MDHLAIMNPKWHLIEKILSGQKTIESRWYVHKIAPWNKITTHDTIYFKDAGKMVTATAVVSKVLQCEITKVSGAQMAKEYQQKLCFTDEAITNLDWLNKKKYALLIFLENPQTVVPFAVNKKGYGSACAWITIDDINKLKA